MYQNNSSFWTNKLLKNFDLPRKNYGSIEKTKKKQLDMILYQKLWTFIHYGKNDGTLVNYSKLYILFFIG